MNNSMTKLFIIAVLLFTVACTSKAENAIDCAKTAIGKNSLVRIDDTQQRIFIQKTQVSADTLRPLITKIQSCLKGHAWSSKWSLSVFSERKLAGYKDEPNIIPFHENDEWSKGYLAEYDVTSKTLTLNPVTHPSEIYVSN